MYSIARVYYWSFQIRANIHSKERLFPNCHQSQFSVLLVQCWLLKFSKKKVKLPYYWVTRCCDGFWPAAISSIFQLWGILPVFYLGSKMFCSNLSCGRSYRDRSRQYDFLHYNIFNLLSQAIKIELVCFCNEKSDQRVKFCVLVSRAQRATCCENVQKDSWSPRNHLRHHQTSKCRPLFFFFKN